MENQAIINEAQLAWKRKTDNAINMDGLITKFVNKYEIKSVDLIMEILSFWGKDMKKHDELIAKHAKADYLVEEMVEKVLECYPPEHSQRPTLDSVHSLLDYEFGASNAESWCFAVADKIGEHYG